MDILPNPFHLLLPPLYSVHVQGDWGFCSIAVLPTHSFIQMYFALHFFYRTKYFLFALDMYHQSMLCATKVYLGVKKIFWKWEIKLLWHTHSCKFLSGKYWQHLCFMKQALLWNGLGEEWRKCDPLKRSFHSNSHSRPFWPYIPKHGHWKNPHKDLIALH